MGYLRGLKDSNISEFGKILAIADVYSAMTSVRSYKDAISSDSTLKQMTNSKGFDESIMILLSDLDKKGALK